MGISLASKQNRPDSLNKNRSKVKNNLNLEFRKLLTNYIDSFQTYKLFNLKRIDDKQESDIISVKLNFKNKSTSYDYMDPYVANLCTLLSNELRDGFGHNVWFDLKNGIFYFYVKEN